METVLESRECRAKDEEVCPPQGYLIGQDGGGDPPESRRNRPHEDYLAVTVFQSWGLWDKVLNRGALGEHRHN